MVGDINFSGLIYGMLIIGFVAAALLWGIWELINWIWIDDAIRTTTPITPEIELIITENNQIDTIYVYRKP